MEIMCLHPTIIMNKSRHVNRVFRSHDWKMVLRGQNVHCVPPPKKARITHDDLDDCYYYNVKTGEMIPMYIEVPCQKCIICRDKKAVEWATRVTCECNYHINCPWWITLTLNDYNVSEKGVIKRDLQLFFKRFRERISRLVGRDVRIRFVGIGEYGSNTARPHYHTVVFGLPINDAKKVLALIEQAWSYRISRARFLQICNEKGDDGHHYTIVREDIHGKPLYYLRQGFAYVKPAHDNTPLYLAKYMFKPEINTPEGCNPNFCLSSRKNGIGYGYIQEYMDYHRNNPEVTKIKFLNKHTAKMCEFGIPRYFKDYWFPTPSKLVPNEVRKSFDAFQSHLQWYNDYSQYMCDHFHLDLVDDVDSMIKSVNEKYFFWQPILRSSANVDVFKEWIEKCVRWKDAPGYHFVEWFGMPVPLRNAEFYTLEELKSFVRKRMLHMYELLNYEYEYLMSLEFSPTWMSDLLDLRDIHKGAITQMMLSQPMPSVKEREYQLREQNNRRKYKDMY